MEHFKAKKKKIGDKLKIHYSGMVVLGHKDKMEYFPTGTVNELDLQYACLQDAKESLLFLCYLLSPSLCLLASWGILYNQLTEEEKPCTWFIGGSV